MQLKLFTPSTPGRSHSHARIRKTRTPALGANVLWDLWTEQPESEREMALFFLDLRNFTPLTGSIQALDILHLVKKMLSVFQRIVKNHHGRIIETTGDGFYAAFGFDQGIDQAVGDAVNAGHAILKYLESMNASSFEKRFGRKIEAGIGVHAGKVATGRITLAGNEHLMVMGYPVNIASRLQTSTKELNNNFVISSAAFSLLASPPATSRMTRIKLKGVLDEFQVCLIGNKYSS